jgi:hypothetical protein
MKVVLFCGGFGMRMRDGASDLPKPMHQVGPRPLIWHVMRYYAHFGHTDFVLCLGYGAHHIKDFFLRYDETASNDFVMRGGGVELLGSDIQDWTITFVHTGLDSPIGERLRRVRAHVEGEDMFLANYADVLTDAPLDKMIEPVRPVRRDRRAARGAPAVGLPLREPGRGRCDLVDQHADGDAAVGERRVPDVPAGDLRPRRGGLRPDRGRVRAAGEGRPDDGLPAPRLSGSRRTP